MRLANISDASPEQIRVLQLRELKILKEIRPILEAHSITFFINGGTLIGALRHKGFIPWDDDMDLLMLRDDFERLSAHPEWFNGTKFIIERSNAKINQHLTGLSLKDTTTTLINKHSVNEDLVHSMCIDVTPIDYRPVGKVKRYLQIFYAAIFSLYNADRVPDHQGKFLRVVARLPLAMVPGRKAKYRIWTWAQSKMVALDDPNSGEVVELGVGYKALFQTKLAKWFSGTVDLPFEDTTLPGPVGGDEYLRAINGDYMQMPPVSSRVAKHNTYLVDTERPYTPSEREPFIKK